VDAAHERRTDNEKLSPGTVRGTGDNRIIAMADDPNTQPPPAGDTPPPETPPWHAGAVDPKTGQLVANWHALAPEEERADWERHKDAKTPWDVITGERAARRDAQTKLRAKQDAASGLPPRPEGDKATPEAWAEYRKARGLPADPKEYGVTRPDDFPAELWNEKETEDFLKFALEEAELSPAQVKAITGWYQGRGKEALTLHQTAMAAQKAMQDKARADYVQAQKETLHQNHGLHVDRDLKVLAKLGAVSGLDPESFNPDNPDKFVGADVVKAMTSLVAMLPKSGDPTARMLGRTDTTGHRDIGFWKALKADSEEWKILANPMHPGHKALSDERDAAYQNAEAMGQFAGR
jgi:hypothetical protein